MPEILRTDFNGDPNLGLLGFATDRYCLIGPNIKNRKGIEDALKVPVIEATTLGTNLIGIFSAGNSTGVVIPDIMNDYEIEKLKEKNNILILNTKYTAIGNLVLLNDCGCLISKLIRNEKDKIEKFFGVDCEIITVSKMDVIGSIAIATNKGCLIHPNINEMEAKQIERILKVKVDIGTANFGSPFVGSCLIANSNGLVVSNQTTGPELARIEETIL